MEQALHIFILLPFAGFIISLFIPAHKENWLSQTAFVAVGATFISIQLFILLWLYQGMPILNVKDLSLYQHQDYNFFIDFYFDNVSAVYLAVGGVLTFLVTVYSRYYLHRESGYKRFFNTVLFFYFGYNVTVLSGNLETLFIGWEVLGISSFLLIAFYRNRYLPVRNAIKVFTIYRIGDVGILLAMWMMHHLWHENITFLMLDNQMLVHDQLIGHTAVGVFISIMILLAATAKSAQFPFTAWLPRAMEGPTPSSAIFYGSLSVHIGAFLLLRTFPFWEQQLAIRLLIGFIGLITAILSTLIANVQSTIKSQIAYASAAQIGLIFIEIALGLEWLALFHFAGNAFLRSYQLLISPSVVTYMIREQFYHFSPVEKSTKHRFLQKWHNTIYVLSQKEWHLEYLVYSIFIFPLKKIKSMLNFISRRNLIFFFLPVYSIGFYISYFSPPIDANAKNMIAVATAFVALLMVARAYHEHLSARLSWFLVIAAHFFIDLAVTFNEHFSTKETLEYLSGVVFSGIIGYIVLLYLRAKQKSKIELGSYQGLVAKYPRLAMVFFLACLGLAGFPITTTFIGEDALLTHVHEDQIVLASFIAITFIINGITLIRIYARIFLGPHPSSLLTKNDITS